jgi:hypothetical protein
MGQPVAIMPPHLRADLPLYPAPLQLLRVTTGTVPGPSGYASASVLAASLYIASTQQLQDNLLPRDREPCLALDVTRTGLASGYYLGRLSHSWQSLPVYEVVGSAVSPTILPGLTTDQLTKLTTNLTPTQIAVLNNLTACQLQTFIQLSVTDIQRLTTNFTPPQLTRIVDDLTFTLLKQVVTTTTTAHTLVASSTYPQLYQLFAQALTPPELTNIFLNLTSQGISTLAELDRPQLALLPGLTIPQLQKLTSLTIKQVPVIVGDLTLLELRSVLDDVSTANLRLLANKLTKEQIKHALFSITAAQLEPLIPGLARWPGLGTAIAYPQLPVVSGEPTASPTSIIPGYGAIVLDEDGNLWGYIDGDWVSVGGGASAEYAADTGDGVSTTLTVTHNLNTRDVLVQVREAASGYEYIDATIKAATVNTVTITFAVAPSSGQYRVIILKNGGSGSSEATARTEGTLAATGNSQATAALIITDAVSVTASDGTKGVLLPNTAGAIIAIHNTEALGSLNVYPNSGAKITGGATDAAQNIAGSVKRVYWRISSTQWFYSDMS